MYNGGRQACLPPIPIGQQLLERYNPASTPIDSVALIADNQIYFKSDAALHIARRLGGIWSVASMFRLMPRRLRDSAYDWVAAHRYQIFGRSDTCLINSPSNAERFLDTLVSAAR